MQGSSSPHLWVACGAEVMVDFREPIKVCPKCSEGIADTFDLEGQEMPGLQIWHMRIRAGFLRRLVNLVVGLSIVPPSLKLLFVKT